MEAEKDLAGGIKAVNASFLPGRPSGCPGGRVSRVDERTEVAHYEAAVLGDRHVVDIEGQEVVGVLVFLS